MVEKTQSNEETQLRELVIRKRFDEQSTLQAKNEVQGFNVADFIATIGTGVLKPNKFLAQIYPPPALYSLSKNVASRSVVQTLRFWCESATLPGVMLETHPIKRFGIGPSEKRPHAPTFNDVTLVFIADKDGDNLKMFRDWLKLVNGYNPVASAQSLSEYGLSMYELNYKEDYACNMEIIVYDDEGIEKSTTVLYEAFPIGISDIPLNWNSNDTYMKISVTFTFLGWDYVPTIQ